MDISIEAFPRIFQESPFEEYEECGLQRSGVGGVGFAVVYKLHGVSPTQSVVTLLDLEQATYKFFLKQALLSPAETPGKGFTQTNHSVKVFSEIKPYQMRYKTLFSDHDKVSQHTCRSARRRQITRARCVQCVPGACARACHG